MLQYRISSAPSLLLLHFENQAKMDKKELIRFIIFFTIGLCEHVCMLLAIKIGLNEHAVGKWIPIRS